MSNVPHLGTVETPTNNKTEGVSDDNPYLNSDNWCSDQLWEEDFYGGWWPTPGFPSEVSLTGREQLPSTEKYKDDTLLRRGGSQYTHEGIHHCRPHYLDSDGAMDDTEL